MRGSLVEAVTGAVSGAPMLEPCGLKVLASEEGILLEKISGGRSGNIAVGKGFIKPLFSEFRSFSLEKQQNSV